jgi:predicted esterase
VRNRLLAPVLSLLLLALTPGWALARFEHGPKVALRRAPQTGAWVAPAKASATITWARAAAPATVVRAPAKAAAPAVAQAGAVQPLADWSLYLPPDAANRQPLQILVALHGMGGNGPDFAKPLLPVAEQHGWAVLAPTMPYRDYRDPELVRGDGQLLPRLKAVIDALPTQAGLAFRPQVTFFGFSRGSQEAHRFSFMYPESTLAVAGLSAGSYTLPSKVFKQNASEQILNYPFGVGDVEKICGRVFNPEAARKVAYWIAVGGSDVRNEDVPRQWDRLLGINRVERAQRFVGELQQFGARASVTVYPNVGHEVTSPMRDEALGFLASVSS